RLSGKMEALETVSALDAVERRVHEMHFQQRFAENMIAGGPADADPRQIDRRGFSQLRKRVRHLHEIVGIDVNVRDRRIEGDVCVLVPGGRYPLRVLASPGFWVDIAEIVALQKNHRARTLATRRREVVADAKVLLVDVQP